ncbi:MAG: tetratricopeptide repeat protein [Pseudomonadota bacterium]
MSNSHPKIYTILHRCIILFFILLVLPHFVWAKQSGIKKIKIGHDPLSVQFYVTGHIPIKVVKVEPRELLVALKNVTLEKGFTIEGEKGSGIANIAVEKLSGNVIAVVLTSKQPYGYIQSKFNSANSIFMVDLEEKGLKTALQSPSIVTPPDIEPVPVEPVPVDPQVSTKKEASIPDVAKKAALPDPITISDVLKFSSEANNKERSLSPQALKSVNIPTPSVYVPPVREKSKYQGDINDIVQKIDQSDCGSLQLEKIINLLRTNLYSKAFELLDQNIMQENFTCLEEAFFLKAYAFLKSVKKEDYAQLITAERLFQDALISYPKSNYTPYGYAAIGLIQKNLNNISAAEGYFNIIKQGYLEYKGLAEIMYHLADIYDAKGHQDKALTYYKQVFEDTQENSYIANAGVGYGKMLFNKRQYLESLAILNYVVEAFPKKIYGSSDVLLFIGNANYEVGLSQKARESLNRVLNLFPDMSGRDVILSRIGDTYGMENNVEKAIKVYELTREKFPDSQGYIASSIGIARYLKKDKEKMEIYQMIKTKFPEDKFSRIAMMRMAEIYQKNGEYNKCIREIEDLLSTHPRGLRYEAVKLMQKAYEQLFKTQLKKDEYTQVLNRYELEHNRIDRMGSRQLELSVGLAYLEAKLYEEAFNHLINAYKQYKRSSRSSELLFGLGVAMDESGRDDDALKLFDAFANRFTKDKHRVTALLRAGEIYREKKKYTLSSKKFDQAYKAAKTSLEKGEILMSHANVFEKKGDFKTASSLREKAVKEIALVSGENYEALSLAYKELGRTYIVLKKYVQSADAYDKALNFSKNEMEKANLGFLLGDAYQKGNILSKAKEAYKQVVASYDSVWARLAQQRLSTLELAQSVQNS